MTKQKALVTLVGVKQAKIDFTFINEGPLKDCEECALLKTCVEKLEPERVYTVTGVRKKAFPCKVHEGGVQVVEVAERDAEASIEEKLAIQDCILTFQPQECREVDCENCTACSTSGLRRGDRCRVIEIKGRIKCQLGRKLVHSVLRRLPGKTPS